MCAKKNARVRRQRSQIIVVDSAQSEQFESLHFLSVMHDVP